MRQEDGTSFVKSTHSAAGNCVEVRRHPDAGVTLRDSKHPEVELEFSAAEWNAFLAGVRDGEFDLG